MPRANRTLKGNKRNAVHDRLIVPENGYKLPPQIRQIKPDLPLEPVGQKVWIDSVIIYEVSISYEGKPQRFIKQIPFSDIVGEPVTSEQLDKGYEYVTPQGETLLVKWYAASNRENQGLIIHNKGATGTSWYEPNWGQVYGVGVNWYSCDGTMSGTIWANRHLGNTLTDIDGNMERNLFDSTQEPDFSPNAVRPGLMLGNPEPEKTLWLMGQELPMRVYPALGEVGEGCIFGFNKNVMKFLTVKPPIPSVLAFTGAGTARGDAVGVDWRKDELHTGFTRLGMQVLSGGGLIESTNPPYPTDGSVALISPPTDKMSGGGEDLSSIRFRDGAGEVRIRLMLLECDAAGTPQFVLNCNENVWHWTEGASSCTVTIEPCSAPLPFPEKVEVGCGQASTPIEQPTNPTPSPTVGQLSYFCDNSVPTTDIDTTYWNLVQYGISPEFWDGRNDLLDLFANSDPTTAYRNGKVTVAPFHYYLFRLVNDVNNGSAPQVDSTDWQSFKTWCNQEGLTCLTDLQKASLYCSYRLGVPVNFFQNSASYLNGDTLTVLMDTLSMLPRGIYDWIDFNDVVANTSGGVTGAYAADIPDASFSGFRSYVNFEPQALQYGIDTAIAHRPVDYVMLPNSSWGTETAVDWSPYNLSNMTDANFLPYVIGEVGVHEIGHAVSYFGLDHYGQTLHEMPEWLNISGWAGASNPPRLSKSRAADATGGMPLTDTNHEAPVSDYGCFSPAEDFAEAYRMFIINPTFLEDKYPQKYAFMVSRVEPMFG